MADAPIIYPEAPAAPAPSSDGWIPAVDPSGRLVDIPATSIPDAMTQGFRMPTAAELHEEALQKRYGEGFANVAGTAIEHAGNMLTGGLYGATLPREQVLEHSKRNPIAGIAGDIAGVGVGLAAGELGPIGALNVPAQIAKAGRAASGAVEGLGMAGLAGRVAPIAAAAATEGALYGAQNVAERAVIRDPELTAQKAISEIGLSALLGGGIGAGGALAVEGISGLVSKATKGLESLAARAAKGDEETVRFMFEHKSSIVEFEQRVPGSATAISNSPQPVAKFILDNRPRIEALEGEFPGVTEILSRVDPETGKKILANWDKLLKDPQARIAVGEAQGQAVQGAYTSIEDAVRTANKSVRPKEIDRLLGGAQGAPDEYLYHVTPSSNEAAIAREGLRPDAPKIAEGGPHGETKAVFLGDEQAAQTYRDIYGDETSVYRVRKGRLSDLEDDLHSEGNAWLTRKAIPPHALERQIGDEWVPVTAEASGGEYGRIFDAVDQLAAEMRRQPELYPAMYPKKLELIRDAMVRDVGGQQTQADVFRAINGVKQQVGDLAKFGKNIPPEHEDAVRAIKALGGELRSSLENANVWGEAGTRQASYNAALNEYLTAKKALEKTLMQKVTTKTGAVTYEVAPTKVNSWINLMADARGQAKSKVFEDYVTAAKKLAGEIEASGGDAGAARKIVEGAAAQARDIQQRANVTYLVKSAQGHEILSSGPAIPMPGQVMQQAGASLMGKVIPGGIVGTVEHAITSVRNPTMMTGVLNTLEKMAQRSSDALGGGVGRIFGQGAAAAAAEAAANVVDMRTYPKVAERLNRYAMDPEHLADEMSRQTYALQDHAPSTTQALHGLASRAANYLQAKLPQATQRAPLDAEYRPSPAELAIFNRHYEIAHKPMRVLEHVAKGTVTPEHVETLKVIYPQLFTEMQAGALDRLAREVARGRRLPYRMRLSLSMFLGQDLDSSTKPQSLAANMASFAAAPVGPPGGPPSGAKNLDVASRALTPMQRSAERKEA